jgi:hypothetical protein
VKVCSTTFLSLSWPKLLSGKYWFSWFSGWFSSYSNTGSAGHSTRHSTGFCLVETGSPILKPVQLVFALFTFSCLSAVSAKKRNFLKTGSTGFLAEK